MTGQNERQKQWAKVVAKAWADEGYKQRLLDDPAAMLAAEGMNVPEGMEVKILEAAEKQVYFILPSQPEVDLTESEVEERCNAY